MSPQLHRLLSLLLALCLGLQGLAATAQPACAPPAAPDASEHAHHAAGHDHASHDTDTTPAPHTGAPALPGCDCGAGCTMAGCVGGSTGLADAGMAPLLALAPAYYAAALPDTGLRPAHTHRLIRPPTAA
jgi:hypothetical protein